MAALAEHAPKTVQQMGWGGIKNGKLLERAAGNFDVLFTVDRDFAGLGDQVAQPIGVVILQVGSTDCEALLPHMDAVNAAVAQVGPGEVLRIGG